MTTRSGSTDDSRAHDTRFVLLFAAGAALFEGSRLLVKHDGVARSEERIFRAANDASDSIVLPTRALMQAGTFGSVPAAAAVALLARRRRLAAGLALGGTAAWLLAKAAKPLGGRPRPGGVLPDVRIREKIAGDLGWPSGHTAVATTLALVSAPDVPSWSRPLLAGAVAGTGFGRMYVGAHLPLDLAAGAGLGMMIAAVIRRVGDYN